MRKIMLDTIFALCERKTCASFVMRQLLEPCLTPFCACLYWSFVGNVSRVGQVPAMFPGFIGTMCSNSANVAGRHLVNWCLRSKSRLRLVELVGLVGNQKLVPWMALDVLFQHMLALLGLIAPMFRFLPIRYFPLPPSCVPGSLARSLIQCPNKRSWCEGFRTRHLVFGWANFLVGTSDRLVAD